MSDELHSLLDSQLGYLNFSDGTPSAAFQSSVDRFYRWCQREGIAAPWHELGRRLTERLETVADAAPAFRDSAQVRAVIGLVFDGLLPAYRAHHRDLLAHLPDGDLYAPFLLCRMFEAVLAEREPGASADQVVRGALERLNDFVGHRPIAVLENRRLETYPHERVRPIPLYIRDAGVACGKYEGLVTSCLRILRATDPDRLAEVRFDPDHLDELAVDPRAYDHTHPVNQRAGYSFGEWDPHHIDQRGFYRRFIVRPMVLDAMLDWAGDPARLSPEAGLFEAACALAGTILLAAGISGAGPDTHDSLTSLAVLVPRIARSRDAFYDELLAGAAGSHGDALREEAKRLRQPFGGVRQHLNHNLAHTRAAQLQHEVLARLYARMGGAEASRRHASAIDTPSIRMRAELHSLLARGNALAARGEVAEIAGLLGTIDDLLRRAIECGALVDPWNILGFAGQFSTFPALENSVADPRVEQLLELMQDIFDLMARGLREAAARGDRAARSAITRQMQALAQWWDQFATVAVSDVRRVSGGELAESAGFVAEVLEEWRKAGPATADRGFWSRHARRFRSPRAYATVVDALLERGDYAASMALLMRWLGDAEQAPLDTDGASFFRWSRRWMDEAVAQARAAGDRSPIEQNEWFAQIAKFLDFLEANADEQWTVPATELEGAAGDAGENPFAAAYEGVSFRDSTADGHEGSTLEGPATGDADSLAEQAAGLRRRLDFLSAVAQLWQSAAAAPWSAAGDELRARLASWAPVAARNRQQLLELLRQLARHEVRRPGGSHEAMVEFDRQQAIREELLTRTIAAAIATAQALRRLVSAASATTNLPQGLDAWEPLAIGVQTEIARGDVAAVCRKLPALLAELRKVPLLYVALDHGGNPHEVFAARHVRLFLRELVEQLPMLGLYRETFHVLQAAQAMESAPSAGAQRISEFNLLFPAGYQAVLESLAAHLPRWEQTRDDDQAAAGVVGLVIRKFSGLWSSHIETVRFSELERRVSDRDWEGTVEFIRRYGGDLFTQRFMTYGNLRGILYGGIEHYLDSLAQGGGDEAAPRLVEELGAQISKKEACENLGYVLRAILENYDAYTDYNTLTTQSDYGENLHMLLDMLRLRTGYERQRLALEPAYQAHAVLARHHRRAAAALLCEAFQDQTSPLADQLQQRLGELEQRYAMRLPTIADRIGERFVKPLSLDRLLALVEPALRETRDHPPGEAFARFEQELEPLAQTTTGSGLQTPPWIVRLEEEIRRALGEPPEDDDPPGPPNAAPATWIDYAELQRQLADWDAPPA